MSFQTAIEEILVTSAPARIPADRVALARLDALVGKLEDLNLHEVKQVPMALHFEIVHALEGLMSHAVPIPEAPSKALELVFAGQARILRGLYPEFQDEFDDE